MSSILADAISFNKYLYYNIQLKISIVIFCNHFIIYYRVIIYYRGKIVGGIYDDRLLVKKTKSALKLMPTAVCDVTYEGAKEMLLIDEIDDKEFLIKLIKAMYDELPLPKRKNF